jgi:acyl dehydratase
MQSERRYFEDIEVGEEFTTATRTVTESDVLAYAGLSGDFEELHVSEEFAKGTIFGQRVAHGLLGLVLLDGLKTRTSLVTSVKTIASLGWTWDFPKPLKFGDTIEGRFVIANKRRTSKGDRGILYIQAELRNQHGEILQKGENRMMVACRTMGEPGPAGQRKASDG